MTDDDAVDLALLGELCEQLGGDVVSAIAESYAANSRQLLRIIADRGNDPVARRQAAHSLKGASGSVGLAGVARLCRDIETAFRDGGGDVAESLVARLPQAIEDGQALLRIHLAMAP